MTAVEMMRSPSCWPIPGYLPLATAWRRVIVRHGCARSRARGPVVYLGCLHPREPDLEGSSGKRAERRTYFTFADLAERVASSIDAGRPEFPWEERP